MPKQRPTEWMSGLRRLGEGETVKLTKLSRKIPTRMQDPIRDILAEAHAGRVEFVGVNCFWSDNYVGSEVVAEIEKRLAH